MVHYRLYFLNAAGNIIRANDIDVADDDAAKDAARILDHAHHIEIWTGTRKVGTVMPEKGSGPSE